MHEISTRNGCQFVVSPPDLPRQSTVEAFDALIAGAKEDQNYLLLLSSHVLMAIRAANVNFQNPNDDLKIADAIMDHFGLSLALRATSTGARSFSFDLDWRERLDDVLRKARDRIEGADWRTEYRRRQDAGERFEYHSRATGQWAEQVCDFTQDQDRYRPVRLDIEHLPADDAEGGAP